MIAPSAMVGFSWTSLVGAGLALKQRMRIDQLSDLPYWRTQTARLQLAQLRCNLKLAQNTEFGRSIGFARICRISDDREMLAAYRAAVPIADWYVYKDLIARMREGGEPDLLWPGLVEDFAQTSGTTAGDKYIPVSKHMLKSNFHASLDIFGHMSRFGVSLPELTAGRSLFLGGSTKLDTNAKGIRTGDLSGIVTPLIRWPISEIYLPGPEIALESNWPVKIEKMARRCLHEDVRMISGMPSWALVVFARVMELAREEGRDVHTLADVWPNLTIFVHGGVRYAPFDPRVRQMWSGSPDGPDLPHRLELYPASEGFIAMQDTAGDPGLRLCSDQGNFFEFVPLEDLQSGSTGEPRAFGCWDVEKGQKYVVVMSTCAGLYRYVLGDVVEFDTIPGTPEEWSGPQSVGDGPCRLRIVGRHKHFINAFGENLIVEHIETAVTDAARAAGVQIGEFTAAPVYPQNGQQAGLELAIELSAVPSSTQLITFRDAFDASLKRQNVDYTTKRTDGVGMGSPTITPLPLGTFHRWLQSRGKLGGQHKCPRCANTRETLEAVKGVGAGAQ
jgi:hypothetical protein